MAFFPTFSIYAHQVCLNMIIKDEGPVIRRCLERVKPLIDYWVIVDTGSTDGTQEIVRNTLKGIPGELHERLWKNFEHNRNEALELAKKRGDYILFIDADEQIEYPEKGQFPPLAVDCYLAKVKTKECESWRILLAKTTLPWKWQGVLHETLCCETSKPTASHLYGITIRADTEDGHRSQDPDKYLKDAAILEEALKENPHHARYTIFLAESYFVAKRYELALKAYKKRATLGKWDQEVYYALYRAACCEQLLEHDPLIVIEAYTKAFRYRPTRAEPLYRLASYYLQIRDFPLAYKTAKQLLDLPLPEGDLQLEPSIYHYLGSALFAECALYLQQYGEAKSVAQAVLQRKNLPQDVEEKMESIMRTCRGK